MGSDFLTPRDGQHLENQPVLGSGPIYKQLSRELVWPDFEWAIFEKNNIQYFQKFIVPWLHTYNQNSINTNEKKGRFKVQFGKVIDTYLLKLKNMHE